MRSQDPTAANLPKPPLNGVSPGTPLALEAEGGASGGAPLARSRKGRSRREIGPTMRSIREDYGAVLNFYVFSTLQRMSIYNDMSAAGVRRRLDPAILVAIEDARRFEEALHNREVIWRGRDQAAFAEDARPVGARLERSLSSLATIMGSIRACFAEDHPRYQAAERLLKSLFPGGVGAITNQSFKVEHASVALLLKRAGAGDNARDLELLCLESHVERVAELHEEFGEALQLSETLDYEELEGLRRQGQQALSVIIVRILGRYYGSDAESVAMREAMLRPVVFQHHQLRRAYRRGRSAEAETEATG